MRSPRDEVRRQAREQLFAQISASLAALNLTFEHTQTYEQSAVHCSPWLTATLEEAVKDSGLSPQVLFSGAGHDGLAMADLCDIGMLFVRCREGVSHHPSEAIKPGDLTAAVTVLAHACQRLAKRLSSA